MLLCSIHSYYYQYAIAKKSWGQGNEGATKKGMFLTSPVEIELSAKSRQASSNYSAGSYLFVVLFASAIDVYFPCSACIICWCGFPFSLHLSDSMHAAGKKIFECYLYLSLDAGTREASSEYVRSTTSPSIPFCFCHICRLPPSSSLLPYIASPRNATATNPNRILLTMLIVRPSSYYVTNSLLISIKDNRQ